MLVNKTALLLGHTHKYFYSHMKTFINFKILDIYLCTRIKSHRKLHEKRCESTQISEKLFKLAFN